MADTIQLNMARGELTPYLHARADLDHYRAGLAKCRNWVPLRFGGITRVPGFVFYGETKFGDKYSRFIPFEFRRDQTYAIELGHDYFRFWNIAGQVESSPGVPYEVTHPYIEADLPFVQFRQSGDVIYITCDGYAPRTLTRITETNWVLALYGYSDGPYLPINDTTVTATPNVVGVPLGTVRFTFSNIGAINGGTGFNSGDVGRPFRFLSTDGNWRYYIITAIISTTVVDTNLRSPALPNTTPTTVWRLGAWSSYTGYPAAVGIFEDRLGFGGTVFEPVSAWYSRSGAYNSFQVSNPVVDDDAISIRMTGGKLNGIQWLADTRDIIVGTEGSLRAVGRNDLTGAFSPTNVRQRTESALPAAYLPPLLIEQVMVVLDIYRTKLFETAYTQSVEGYLAKELTALNEHLIGQGVRDWCYQSSPHKIIWMVTDEGKLLTGVYDRDQEVFGVTECDVGGDGYVEAICTLPGTNKDGDQIWITVRRTVDGSVKRYVEFLSAFYRDGFSEQDYPIYAHSAGVYQGVAANSISGITHLEGETVGIWCDGVDVGDCVVTGGVIEWNEALSGELVVFGLRYLSDARTLRLATNNQYTGSSLGKRMNLTHARIDVYQSYGLDIGTLSGLDTMRIEAEAEEDPYDPATLRTGSYTINLDDSWENNGVCVIQTSSMHPATIRAITVDPEIE